MAGDSAGLRILHCLRAPVGGLFRHVRDLANAQQAAGHEVGIVADASSGGAAAEDALQALAADLLLGVERLRMPRHAGFGDLAAIRAVARWAAELRPDVLHGHGAKGGAYARLAAPRGTLRVYTPHGGSLHYTRRSPVGLAYLEAERLLAGRTDLALFESDYGREAYEKRVGAKLRCARVVHNGVGPAEFVTCEAPPDAASYGFVGELRELKGVGDFLQALASLVADGREPRALIAGGGPDEDRFRRQSRELGLQDRVEFLGVRPAREVFAQVRCLVVPSWAESLPYVVLEAAAAGLPVVATAVGGVPEIFGPQASRLVPARDTQALAAAMARAIDTPDETARLAAALRERVRERFSLSAMAAGIEAAYREALHLRPSD